MSALFNFNSFLVVVLLVICTCTYVKMQFPAMLNDRTGFRGFFWKAARIGERLSPWVAFGCFAMGISTIFF
ncbi:protein kish-like [Lolium rigidum]|uniref:protein kish-like n=1 Tax=Lolium rigidum TaxID=89674 RepID=UPI001F5D0986|nr:protein kish-like [Lolium rigidum]XP_047070415.1 protein kish-like [Lolium rigidum]